MLRRRAPPPEHGSPPARRVLGLSHSYDHLHCSNSNTFLSLFLSLVVSPSLLRLQVAVISRGVSRFRWLLCWSFAALPLWFPVLLREFRCGVSLDGRLGFWFLVRVSWTSSWSFSSWRGFACGVREHSGFGRCGGGGLKGGMGRGAMAMSSWCEIAPPQMITVERCSPRQKTMETILERMAALGAMVETAPPQIILVERSLSQKRGSLDTIAEESISMAVDLANGAAAAASVRPLSGRRLESSSASSSSSSSSSSSQVRRITPGFVACN